MLLCISTSIICSETTLKVVLLNNLTMSFLFYFFKSGKNIAALLNLLNKKKNKSKKENILYLHLILDLKCLIKFL